MYIVLTQYVHKSYARRRASEVRKFVFASPSRGARNQGIGLRTAIQSKKCFAGLARDASPAQRVQRRPCQFSIASTRSQVFSEGQCPLIHFKAAWTLPTLEWGFDADLVGPRLIFMGRTECSIDASGVRAVFPASSKYSVEAQFLLPSL